MRSCRDERSLDLEARAWRAEKGNQGPIRAESVGANKGNKGGGEAADLDAIHPEIWPGTHSRRKGSKEGAEGRKTVGSADCAVGGGADHKAGESAESQKNNLC